MRNGSSFAYGFQGMLRDDETSGSGNHYSTFERPYDPRLGRWWKTDPVTHPMFSPYNAFDNNPIYFTDPTGGNASTDVTKNKDGTYTVVGGDLNDGDKGIYVVDDNGNRTGEKIGESLTMNSFHNSDTQDDPEQQGWKGTIDPNSTESGDLASGFVEEADGISILEYMPNATDGKKYDFKRGGDPESKNRNFHHRGSLWSTKSDGTKVYGTARDAGNFAAGYIAGLKGLSWSEARLGFDGLEFLTSPLRLEGSQSTKAQRVGHNQGSAVFKVRRYEEIIRESQSFPSGSSKF